ncbi:MAG: alpha/beta fold hydrolase [Microthrixaceae bacterium]
MDHNEEPQVPEQRATRRRRRTGGRLLGVCAVAVLLVCSTDASLAARPRSPLTGPVRSDAAAPAPEPGVLDWTPCSDPAFEEWKRIDGAGLDGFECSPFVRPLDRDHPEDDHVTLAVVKFPATGTAEQRIGTLFLNPGGPGQSGLGLSEIVYLLPEPVRASFDFVTYDPRGIGASTPALKGRGCNIPKPTRPDTGEVDWKAVLTARQKQVARANERCWKANEALIEHGGTVDGAHDLDALRAAVGDDKITYWGISYGTLLGSTYAQLFPERVRALVFDGNMDPQTTLAGIASAGSVAPDDSIGFFLQATGLRTKFDEVMAELDDRTIDLTEGERYTRWDLLDVLNDGVDFFPITGDQSWAQAARAVNESWDALFGSDAEKEAARTALTDATLRSPTTGTAGSLWSAVVCQDLSDRMSNDRQQQLLKRITREAPIYGGSLGVDYLTTCNGYGDAEPRPVLRPAKYGPPIPGMIANSTRDGETPYQWAVNMARTYPTMRAITIVGGIHGTFGLSQSDCVDDAIAQALISATSPALDAACPFSPPDPAA